MFCPRCATENEPNLSYCRQCGQALSGVQLALEGNATQSIQRLTAAEKWIKGGAVTLVSFMCIALMITSLGVALGQPTLSTIAMINALLGALIGLPLVFVGKARLKQERRLLSHTTSEKFSAIRQASTNELPQPQIETDMTRLAAPNSITEQTTLNLQKSAQPRRDK